MLPPVLRPEPASPRVLLRSEHRASAWPARVLRHRRLAHSGQLTRRPLLGTTSLLYLLLHIVKK